MKSRIICMLGLCLVLSVCKVNAQNSCQDTASMIIKAYSSGQWNRCKELSLGFIGNYPFEAVNIFSKQLSKSDPSYCYNFIPQVYYYLIKSCLRLNEPGLAKKYYSNAWNYNVAINFDSTDVDLMQRLGVIKARQYSANVFFGVVSANFKEYKIGLSFGDTRYLNFEVNFDKLNFNYSSVRGEGLFGKSLKSNTSNFPNYSFEMSGFNQSVNLAYVSKFSIFKARNSVNSIYISTGAFASYYMSSNVKRYEILVHKMNGTDTVSRFFFNDQRYKQIDSAGVKMDLKNIFKNRLGYGLFATFGSRTKLPKEWEVFAEIRISFGNNKALAYAPLSSFKPGTSFYSIQFGLTKNFVIKKD